MKHLSAILLVSSVVIAAACKDYSEQAHLQQMAQMRDSIFKAYPTVRAISMDVVGGDQLVIALGDHQLYKTSDAHRQQMASDLAHMTLRIFGDSTNIEKEKLVITANDHNEGVEPKDGLITRVSIDSLKKALK